MMLTLLLSLAFAGEPDSCASPEATAAFQTGFAAQKILDTEDALASYTRCLALDPGCVACQYEIGWTYWSRQEWASTVDAWQKTLALQPTHGAAASWLPKAQANAASGGAMVSVGGLRVPIGTDSGDPSDRVYLELIARFQNWDPNPSHAADHHDGDIYSPKSARFLADGSKVYVNSLEGLKTVVYDPRALTKVGVVEHTFEADDAALFHDENTVFGYPYFKRSPNGDPNVFSGKPVESALSHDDRWLWVPYYRRDFDVGAASPSAVAIVDTKTDAVVRVMPTGPIPKYVAISPDQKWAAIVHWGDNTVGLIDISSGDPNTFAYRPERLVVERALPQDNLAGQDRDAACGYCLRGTVFTPDSQTLLVARMGDGGVAGFDVATGAYLGTVDGMRATPRHLAVSPDGQSLYLSSNRSGVVSRIAMADIVGALRQDGDGHVVLDGWAEASVGGGARTLEVSHDGRWLFVAVNQDADLVVVDSQTMRVVARARTDGYTVGLAVSPDGRQVWTTSQGRGGQGGNSVNVFEVRFADEPAATTPSAPTPTPGG